VDVEHGLKVVGARVRTAQCEAGVIESTSFGRAFGRAFGGAIGKEDVSP
jgi:hypothetical protein